MTEHEIRALALVCAGAPAGDVDFGGLGDIARQIAQSVLDAGAIGTSRIEALHAALGMYPGLDAAHVKSEMFRVAADDAAPATSPSGSPPKFHLLSADDLMALPPLRWLVDHHLPSGGMAVLYGPPGAGKSFVALDIAMSVATGTDWLGIERVEGGVVVYVAAEGSAGLAKRVGAWIDARADSRLYRIYFVTSPIQLMEEAEVEQFATALHGLSERPKLVVIDTFARSLVGGDENSAKDVGKAIAGADRIRQEFGCAVLLVHHTGKNGDQERGSSALRAAADAMLKLAADDGSLTLNCEKMKDAAPFETEYLRLQPTQDGDTCIIKPSSGSPVVAGQLTKNHRLVLQTVLELPEGEASWGRIQNASGVAEGSIGRILSGLVKWDFISKQKRHYVLTEKGRSHVE